MMLFEKYKQQNHMLVYEYVLRNQKLYSVNPLLQEQSTLANVMNSVLRLVSMLIVGLVIHVDYMITLTRRH